MDAEKEKSEVDTAPFEVFPANWPTVQAFRFLSTQWKLLVTGEGGIIYQRLMYENVPAACIAHAIPRRDRQEVYLGLHLMESAALEELNKSDDEREIAIEGGDG